MWQRCCVRFVWNTLDYLLRKFDAHWLMELR
jgi:transposase-like protein